MKSLWKKPGRGLAEPAGWTILLGLLAFGVGVYEALNHSLPPIVSYIVWPLGAIYLAVGIGAWQEKRAAAVVGMWMFAIFAVLRLAGLALGFSWSKLGMGLVFGGIAWQFREAIKGWDDLEPDEEDADENERPMISIVLLLRAPRYLEDKILAQEVQSAWGGDYTGEDEEKADGFVVGESPMFIVKSPHGMFMIHNHPSPYFDDLDKVVDGIGELRLRKAVADHRAWLSVDLLSPFDESLPLEDFYAPVTRLVYELAGDDTLAVMRPATGQINLWGDDVLEVLLQPRGFDEFNRVRLAPEVVEVSADDPAMLAAVAEARERWGEFVAAFQARAEGDHFTVKAPITRGETTEFIWIEVTGLEPEFVHGKLGNDPVDLEGLALGDAVEAPVGDVNDWCYIAGEGGPTGLFSLKAISEAQKRQSGNG
jgi:uncharacterized protein YegJ (DUF2314 family)